jgi:hypothetical protein
MQTAVMTDTECIQNIHAIYGSDLERLPEKVRMEAIAILALTLAHGDRIFRYPLALQLPPELHAHMYHLTPKGMRTLINCLNCAPRCHV